jgi:hypothetical protein
MDMLLGEFKTLRLQNLEILKSKDLHAEDLELQGLHPSLGEVSLRNLLATWAVHDLNHIGQIVRVMSWQYNREVGPWKAYLGILNQ